MNTASATSAATTAVWRIRLFWAWHAWRLRHVDAQDAAGAVSVFNNFPALNHCGCAEPLFELHEALTASTSGLVPESESQFRQRLVRELGSPARAALLARRDGSVGGYAWARVAAFGDALDLYQRVASLAHLRGDDWQRIARLCAEDASLLVLGDVGLDTRYRRGFTPLKQLLKPLLEFGLQQNVRRALWWLPGGSPLNGLSAGFGARCVYRGDTTNFYLLDDIRPLARVFGALPAGGISDLLARVAPPRPPAPPRPTVVNLRLVPKTPAPADSDLAA